MHVLIHQPSLPPSHYLILNSPFSFLTHILPLSSPPPSLTVTGPISSCHLVTGSDRSPSCDRGHPRTPGSSEYIHHCIPNHNQVGL